MSNRIGRSTQNKAERSQVSESKALPGSLTRVRRHSGQLLKRFVYNRLRRGQPRAVSVRSIGKPVMRLGTKLAFQPDTVLAAQIRLLRDTTVLWTGVAAASLGGGALKVAEPERSDGRFRDDAWRDILLFDVMKQSYLLSTRWVEDTIADVRGLDAPTRRKLDFYFGQMADALAPSNFVLTNPQVLRATVESRGKNLLNGLANLLRDYDEVGS